VGFSLLSSEWVIQLLGVSFREPVSPLFQMEFKLYGI
jgi:hypothetical protein